MQILFVYKVVISQFEHDDLSVRQVMAWTSCSMFSCQGNIQDANEKIRKKQETSAMAVENLKKIKSDLSSFNSQIADFKGEMERNGDGDRDCSVDKITEGSKSQAEEQAEEGPR